MRFVSFSSGSCGNCSLLLGPHSGIMIDAGVGIRRIKKELESLHLGYADISAILVTHDHGDHIRSLGSFCKRLAVPVWTTQVLNDALLRQPLHVGGIKLAVAGIDLVAIGHRTLRPAIIVNEEKDDIGLFGPGGKTSGRSEGCQQQG